MGKHFSWAIFIMKTNEDIIKKYNWSTYLKFDDDILYYQNGILYELP